MRAEEENDADEWRDVSAAKDDELAARVSIDFVSFELPSQRMTAWATESVRRHFSNTVYNCPQNEMKLKLFCYSFISLCGQFNSRTSRAVLLIQVGVQHENRWN